MTYEIIDLRNIPRSEYQPHTEPELWALMISGQISPVVYQIRACRLLHWPGYARISPKEPPSQ